MLEIIVNSIFLIIVSRFCVAVKREGYPEEAPLLENTTTKGLQMMSQPAHTLTIMYPVMLVNLLPCDLSYQVKNIPAKGSIKAGKSIPLYTVSEMLNVVLIWNIYEIHIVLLLKMKVKNYHRSKFFFVLIVVWIFL